MEFLFIYLLAACIVTFVTVAEAFLALLAAFAVALIVLCIGMSILERILKWRGYDA